MAFIIFYSFENKPFYLLPLTQIGTNPCTLRQRSISIDGFFHILHFQRTNSYWRRWRMHIGRRKSRTIIGIGGLIAVGARFLFRLAALRMVLRPFAITRLETTITHKRCGPLERTLNISAQMLDTIRVCVWCDVGCIELRLSTTR